jgi:hypothetical protein
MELEAAKKRSLEHLDLSATQKRAVASELAPAYGVSLACELTGLPRSSFYYQVDEPDDSDCKVATQEIAGQWPRYGCTCPTAGAGRRIAVQLRRDKQLVVTSKRMRRLMAEMGLKGEPPRRKRRTTNKRHSFPRYPNLVLGPKFEGN